MLYFRYIRLSHQSTIKHWRLCAVTVSYKFPTQTQSMNTFAQWKKYGQKHHIFIHLESRTKNKEALFGTKTHLGYSLWWWWCISYVSLSCQVPYRKGPSQQPAKESVFNAVWPSSVITHYLSLRVFVLPPACFFREMIITICCFCYN